MVKSSSCTYGPKNFSRTNEVVVFTPSSPGDVCSTHAPGSFAFAKMRVLAMVKDGPPQRAPCRLYVLLLPCRLYALLRYPYYYCCFASPPPSPCIPLTSAVRYLDFISFFIVVFQAHLGFLPAV